MNPSIDSYRQHFPHLNQYRYFNYGGQGPMPQVAIEAAQQAQEDWQAMAPFSLAANDWIQQQTTTLRSLMADELGIPASTLTITEDTTVGCNIALWGIDWQPGDRLLITDCEHQGILATVHELQRRFGIEVDICPVMTTLNHADPDSSIQTSIQAALQPRTRLLVLSHILWNTGQVLPLAEIMKLCRSAQVMVMVDAAQSVGMLPLNLIDLGIDFYAFTGHKWWCGPAGVGGLYVRAELREMLHPTFIGWRSVILNAQGKPVRFKDSGERYEVATSAITAYAGLQAAIELHRSFGSAQTRYDLVCDRATKLWQGLQTLPQVQTLATQAPRSGLISFKLAHCQHAELVKYLESKLIYVRLLLDPNCVRACTHYFSTDAEIEQLISTIEQYEVN
jgi:L-cysteine/cystine lyase